VVCYLDHSHIFYVSSDNVDSCKKNNFTKYFPSGETLHNWLDCLKTSEKFMLLETTINYWLLYDWKYKYENV